MLLTVYVRPHAKQNLIRKWMDRTTVKIDVTAAPVDGKANESVLTLLADEFRLPKGSFCIVRGYSTRIKQISVNEGRS